VVPNARGAANRLTQISGVDGAGFVYVAKVERLCVQSVADSIKLIYELSEIPVAAGSSEGWFHVDGALTMQKAALVPKDAKAVIVGDCSKVFLNLTQWRRFAQGRKVYFEKSFRLIFAVVNLYDISHGQFLEMLDGFPPEKLVFNPYES